MTAHYEDENYKITAPTPADLLFILNLLFEEDARPESRAFVGQEFPASMPVIEWPPGVRRVSTGHSIHSDLTLSPDGCLGWFVDNDVPTPTEWVEGESGWKVGPDTKAAYAASSLVLTVREVWA